MSNVIDFQKKRQEKEKEEEKRIKELEKRRKFILNMDEANILINSYINYINTDIEEFQELLTDEDKLIARNEMRIMFSLLRMLFKKYKTSDYYDEITMSWNYKNLYYTIMVSYAGVEEGEEYEYMDKEEKVEMNLYYRLVDLDHEIGDIIYGASSHYSEMPGWMKAAEKEADKDYEIFKSKYNAEFLYKVVLIEDPTNDNGQGYYVKDYPEEFNKVINRLANNSKAVFRKDGYPKGWRLSVEWEELIELLSGYNLEVIPFSEQEVEEVSHIYCIELLEEQIANIINRMENIGMKVSDSFIGN